MHNKYLLTQKMNDHGSSRAGITAREVNKSSCARWGFFEVKKFDFLKSQFWESVGLPQKYLFVLIVVLG
jgi:hypothetical protein